MTDQEELRNIAMQIGYFEEQANGVQRQIAQFQTRARENAAAISALENLQTTQETLFPIGSGVMVKAKLAKLDNVLVDVGAGVVLEKSAAQAISVLKERGALLERGAEQMAQALQEIASRVEELQARGAQLQSGERSAQSRPVSKKEEKVKR